jgi:hypothetical protein
VRIWAGDLQELREAFGECRGSDRCPHFTRQTDSQGTAAKPGTVAGFEADRCMAELVRENVADPERIRQGGGDEDFECAIRRRF